METDNVDKSGETDLAMADSNWDNNFGAYMEAKNKKLRSQFVQEFLEKKQSVVFTGVTVWVDGQTKPNREEIRQIVGLGGGHFETYFSRHLVTHIVAENLSASKLKELKKYHLNSIAVVTPKWVVDSFERGELQPVANYLTAGILDAQQKQLNIPAGWTTDKGFREKIQDCHSMRKNSDNLVLQSRRERWSRSTSENPNFVRDFFAQSRLHFIGSFRARFERKLVDLIMRENISCKVPYDRSKSSQRIVFHVDMDCFFAAVAMARDPHLKDLPIAGIHAGMFVGDARKLAPSLVTVPYDFESYERVSEQIYRIFLEYSDKIEPVSIDEAYLEMTGIMLPFHSQDNETLSTIEEVAKHLREYIAQISGCSASIGIGSNKILARIATKKAKPDGQYEIWSHEVMEKMASFPVEDLPGVGWVMRRRLLSMSICTCEQLRQMSLTALETQLGKQTALSLYEACRGKDERPLEPYRLAKSIGAEVNWGVRFGVSPEEKEKCRKFILDIVDVVCERLKEAGAKASKLTYKLLRKQRNAGPPRKYLGCGLVDEFSKSTIIASTASPLEIGSRCLQLHESLQIPLDELRGVGIHCSGLCFDNEQHIENVKIPRQLRIDTCLSKSSSNSLLLHENSRQEIPSLHPTDESRQSSNGGTATCTANTDRWSPDNWDSQVFSELPGEIQQELLKYANSLKPSSKNIFSMAQQWKKIRPNSKPQKPFMKGSNASKDASLQPTLTQLDNVHDAKMHGISRLVVADEFQSRSIRECLEFLQDVQRSTRVSYNTSKKYSEMIESARHQEQSWTMCLQETIDSDPFIDLAKSLRAWMSQLGSDPTIRRQQKESLCLAIDNEVQSGRFFYIEGFLRIFKTIAKDWNEDWALTLFAEIEEQTQQMMHHQHGFSFKKLF
eukprot:jgi/Galph1/1748/GphlegSOOS_G422.1